ncbi:MAG: radical SAM protein [Kiritimatiellae bacterium]|nr:radical SAM protein [Kiritimatiellia bacterium]
MTSYDTNFDGQKLIYHPVRVAEWFERGRTRGPIYTEMTLTDRCDCDCMFCGVDYDVNQTGAMMDVHLAVRILDELAGLGNKAIMFCGNGEPLLHPRSGEIIGYGSRRMSASVTTNGLALDRAGIELVDGLEWIRFSVNAGTPEAYAIVHRTKPEMFEIALKNLGAAVERKRTKGLGVTIGVQLVLLEENVHTVTTLAQRVKKLGADYFSVKPYSPHPLSNKHLKVDYSALAWVEAEVKALETESFRVIFRVRSFEKLGEGKPYGRCYGTNFFVFISANGDVWACNNYVGDRRFLLGNARRQSLAEIWQGHRRQEVLEFVEKELNVADCRVACRMDECNRYLWRLKHPRPHDNFI